MKIDECSQAHVGMTLWEELHSIHLTVSANERYSQLIINTRPIIMYFKILLTNMVN